MNRTMIVLLAGLLAPALAHAQVGAQAGASTQSGTDVNAQSQRSGVEASGSSGTSSQANAAAQAGQKSVALSEGTTMNAALAGSLDAKKSKLGDRVEARTTQDVKQDDQVVLRKGTRLVGHVTEVQAREKDQAKSALGVAFDHAELRDGQKVPINVTIQALAASRSAASAGGEDVFASGGGTASAAGSAAAGGGRVAGNALTGGTSAVGHTVGAVDSTVDGAGGAVGSTVNTAAHSGEPAGGLSASGALASNSRGVFGLKDVSLDSTAASATQGSLIVSNTKNVHLDSGTQMVLMVAGQAR